VVGSVTPGRAGRGFDAGGLGILGGFAAGAGGLPPEDPGMSTIFGFLPSSLKSGDTGSGNWCVLPNIAGIFATGISFYPTLLSTAASIDRHDIDISCSSDIDLSLNATNKILHFYLIS
jgi:hypothetical protein